MEEQKKKSLTEISHLFLSSVRENATAGNPGAMGARPHRIPPGGERLAPRPAVPPVSRSAMSIDLTPEEYARVIEESEAADRAATASEGPPIGPISALICSQFNSHQLDRAKEYARHLAANGDRVGLLHLDTAECTVTCFEALREQPLSPPESVNASTPRELANSLNELAWDMDRWVLLLTSPRQPEARALLRQIDNWVLLSTCDHDGVVSCYRAIKGLAELPRPRLTLALLNAADQTEAGKVYRKIAGVCEQFLNWNMHAEAAVEAVESVTETLAMSYLPSDERTDAAQWEVVGEFLARAHENMPPRMKLAPAIEQEIEMEQPAEPEYVEPVKPEIQPMKIAPPTKPIAVQSDEDELNIADLPTGEVTEAAVLSAVIGKTSSGLVECPIRPPACPQATLAVNRDRRLVLLGVARKGLGELRAIAMAYRWVVENRPLLSMALPQFAIDAHAMPNLQLLVDRADSGAELLMPMNENGNVTVQTYRKLRWAGKTGLLLEAA